MDKYTVVREGDEGWELRPSRRHPALHCWYAGYLKHGYTFRFRVQEMPDLLDDTVDEDAIRILNHDQPRPGAQFRRLIGSCQRGMIH